MHISVILKLKAHSIGCSVKPLDYLSQAAQRVLNGDPDGIHWVWHHVMDSNAHLKFDGFLLQHNDPLALASGSPYSRWQQKVMRMVRQEKERRATAATKPKVTIMYQGQTPKVAVEPPDAVELVYCDRGEEAQFIMEHNGVRIYRVEEGYALSQFWVATYADCWHESDDAFDAWDLDPPPDQLVAKYKALFPDDGDKQVLAYNIDMGVITDSGKVK